MLTIDDMIERFDGSIGYATNSKETCQYIADLLKELKERRKTPEIVYCGECKHNPNIAWFGCPASHLSETQRPETAWCWKGERRTDGTR